MNCDVLVKLDFDRGYVGVKTYDRIHGHQGRFLFKEDLLYKVLNDADDDFAFDTDCGNYAEVWRERDAIRFRFVWLRDYSSGEVQGFRQTAKVPADMIEGLLDDHIPIKYLYIPPEPTIPIDTRRAAETIRRVSAVKLKRRALCKAMRDQFHWPDDRITLFDDGGDHFYFLAASGFPKNGGLILHEGTRNGYPCFYYSVHT